LLIVDDHEVVRRGVRSLLTDQTDWEVCGEAVDGQDALDKARELKPDLIVMDVSMPRLNGLEATRQVEEAQFRLGAIVEASEDVIVSKKLDGVITSWNPAATRIFGFKAENIAI
jgi:DNA-binding NarL/FixJ family response regulator